MATRLPASKRTREGLTTLVEGRLSTASTKDELVKPLVEEALGGEATDQCAPAHGEMIRPLFQPANSNQWRL
jgi:hypothetical protein